MTSNKSYTSQFVLQAGDENQSEVTVPNLQVIKLMQSLDSKGFVRTTFNWSHYYWFLTEEGVEYLREYLHLPEDVKPNTEMKSASNPIGGERPQRDGRYGGREGGRYGDRGPRREGGFGRSRNRDEGGYRRNREEAQ